MIARVWHGVTRAAAADAYVDYLNRTGVPESRATAGNRGVYVLRRLEGDLAHFQFISLWDSLDAIRRFSGPDVDKARYFPEDERFLMEMEPNVTHYEVVAQATEQ